MPRMLVALLCLVPLWARAESTGAPLAGTPRTINGLAGDQKDPHVSGDWVTYTNQLDTSTSELRYYHWGTGRDAAIPREGARDSLADLQGSQAVFIRELPTGSGRRVYRFDLRAGGAAEEVAPRTGTDRRAVSVGGHTVAWQEVLVGSAVPAEIHAFHQGTLTLTRLTTDQSVDRAPAVSEDGLTVAWVKCATSVSGCDIWAATEVEGGYSVRQLTGQEGEETQPDTNGEQVVYVLTTAANTDQDIAWVPLEGGELQRLVLPGLDTNPSISGPLIAFEHREPGSALVDIRVYDLRTRTLYPLNDGVGPRSLSDISWSSDGHVRVVWTEGPTGALDIKAYEFRLPVACRDAPGSPSAETVCAEPGNRQLLSTLQASRANTAPTSARISGFGTGVLCVDNGHRGTPATAGQVLLGEGVAMDAQDFTRAPALISRRVPLQGPLTLSAQVEGPAEGSFRARLYGPRLCDVAAEDASFQPTEVREGQDARSAALSPAFGIGGAARVFVESGFEGVLPPLPPR